MHDIANLSWNSSTDFRYLKSFWSTYIIFLAKNTIKILKNLYFLVFLWAFFYFNLYAYYDVMCVNVFLASSVFFVFYYFILWTEVKCFKYIVKIFWIENTVNTLLVENKFIIFSHNFYLNEGSTFTTYVMHCTSRCFVIKYFLW